MVIIFFANSHVLDQETNLNSSNILLVLTKLGKDEVVSPTSDLLFVIVSGIFLSFILITGGKDWDWKAMRLDLKYLLFVDFVDFVDFIKIIYVSYFN